MVQEKKDFIICAEVFDCINILGKKYIDKLPENVYKELEENRDIDYVSKYDNNQGITEDTFSKEALNVLAILDLKYWRSEEERELKQKIYYQNMIIEEEETKIKYDLENIFKKRRNRDLNEKANTQVHSEEEKSLIVQKEKIFFKIKKIILDIIAKIKEK